MTNTSIVRLNDGREVLLSYGVPVAAFIPRDPERVATRLALAEVGLPEDAKMLPAGYIKTARKYSVTTSRHANSYAGDRASVVDDDTFRALIAPVTGGK